MAYGIEPQTRGSGAFVTSQQSFERMEVYGGHSIVLSKQTLMLKKANMRWNQQTARLGKLDMT